MLFMHDNLCKVQKYSNITFCALKKNKNMLSNIVVFRFTFSDK